jgi:hypothetical protein
LISCSHSAPSGAWLTSRLNCGPIRGRPEEGARLLCIGAWLAPPEPDSADERIDRAALNAQRHILRADALTDQARSSESAKLTLASAVRAITAAATALETGRHSPVMVIAEMPTAVAVGHSLPLLERVRVLHIVGFGEG